MYSVYYDYVKMVHLGVPLEERSVVAGHAQTLVDVLDEDVDLVKGQAAEASLDLVLADAGEHHQHALRALVLCGRRRRCIQVIRTMGGGRAR